MHVFQHVPFEWIGLIEPWAKERGITPSVTRFHLGETPPESADFLVVMGGPMSVTEEDRYPWLVEEKAFLRRHILAGKPALGICLGAQLIASALGAQVEPNREKEVGWFPVSLTDLGESSGYFLPETPFQAFHWHGDTFGIPSGAQWLARSEGCSHQAFSVHRAVGLQFHLEMTRSDIARIAEACSGDLSPGRYVQDAVTMARQADEFVPFCAKQMDHLLKKLFPV